MGSMHDLQTAIAAAPTEEALQAALRVADAYREQVESLKRSNTQLRLEIARLNTPEQAHNAEAAAWRWATGNDAQAIAVCELDGTEWIPVLSSQAALSSVSAEICRRNYGPQWTASSVLARMALGAERGE